MIRKTRSLTRGAFIAALYVALTFLSAALGLASGPIQLRISEALTVLPMFSFSAVPGLFVGCALANLLTGAAMWDVVFGSMATLLGALGTYYFGKNKYVAPVFPVLSNTLIIPFVLRYVYGISDGIWYLAVTVFTGEFISCGIFGVILAKALEKTKLFK